MKTRPRLVPVTALSLMVTACASGPDHFYRLQPLPAWPAGAREQFIAEVSIRLRIPSMVDRNQIVLEQDGNGVTVLEHERWATPLADQLHAVLGQDIEQRRPDILVTSRPVSQAVGTVRYAVEVEIVSLRLQRGNGVTMDVRWRVDPPGSDEPSTGRAQFTAPARGNTAAALAEALSECVSQLAERLSLRLGKPA